MMGFSAGAVQNAVDSLVDDNVWRAVLCVAKMWRPVGYPLERISAFDNITAFNSLNPKIVVQQALNGPCTVCHYFK
jgi:hypothetical protein